MSDITEGHWKQIKGRVKEAFGSLTDDDIERVEGRKDRFVGLLQEKYGVAREEAEQRFENIKQALS